MILILFMLLGNFTWNDKIIPSCNDKSEYTGWIGGDVSEIDSACIYKMFDCDDENNYFHVIFKPKILRKKTTKITGLRADSIYKEGLKDNFKGFDIYMFVENRFPKALLEDEHDVNIKFPTEVLAKKWNGTAWVDIGKYKAGNFEQYHRLKFNIIFGLAPYTKFSAFK